MINAFYTCLVNKSAADMNTVVGADIVDPGYVPVLRHDAVAALADLVFSTDRDHSVMMYARAKQAAMAAPLKLLMDRTSLHQGYSVEDLSNYFWNFMTTPRTGTGTALEYAGKFVTPLYKVNTFRVAVEGAQTVIYSDQGIEIDRQTTSSGPSTSMKVAIGSEVSVLIPSTNTPAGFVWASRPSAGFHDLIKSQWTYLIALCNQVSDLDSTLSKGAITSMLAGMHPSNSSLALATVSMLIAGHTAKLAKVIL